MKIVLGTVVYEQSYKFYRDFVESINNQDTTDFDVLLVNDDLSSDKCNILSKCINPKVVYVNSKRKSTIPELRIQLIKESLVRNYDILVLLDFDDTISKNRISEIRSNFDFRYSFFYNTLCYLDSSEEFFDSLPSTVDEIKPILECNFLGFTNTALNMNKIEVEFLDTLETKQTVAFDWIVFSLLLLQGHKGKKIENCRTYYRLHKENTAGEFNNIDDLKKEIEIKIDHYSKLKDFDNRYVKLYKYYAELRSSFYSKSKTIMNNSKPNNRYWWGRVSKVAQEER